MSAGDRLADNQLEGDKLKTISRLGILISLLCLFSGCLPGSRAYRPVSSWEQQTFNEANRNIFPNDVKTNLATYRNTTVAWPGIILENKFIDHPDVIEIQFVLEHHYYDWIEDFGAQREKIFLSPRGEGKFRTSWFINKKSNVEEMHKFAGPGNLIIVYGTPLQVNDDLSVLVKCTYMRGIEKEWFRTDMLDYGRPDRSAK